MGGERRDRGRDAPRRRPVDLWNYTAPTGASLRHALEYLRPYNNRPETWPATQHAKLRHGFLGPLLTRAKETWADFPATDMN